MPSPPHAAPASSTARSPSPKKRTRATPSPPQKEPKQKRRARVTVEPDETTQVTGQDRYKLPLADADAYYIPDFVDSLTAQRWHDELLKLEEWYQPTLKIYGKPVTQSRKIAAFATDPSLDVKYSGTTVRMSYDYPPLLREIQDLVEAKLNVKFNHVMLNLYENGQIYIGNHRDNRENRVIASLSLGAPRTFILTHDKPPPLPSAQPPPSVYSHRFTLENGSLVVMQGTMQQHWKHQIPKEKLVTQSRISLTFRQLVF
ncbi:2OG-Fe(II) oxygenase [Rhodotorula sp. JG-1b]|nr:2OG-Fe(II) oxygenase [Rhodotorula sp. JG-1b]